MTAWKSFWKAFIPQKISSACITGFLRFVSKFTYITKRRKLKHKESNKAVITEQSEKLFTGKYIENQHDWGAVLFGNGKKNNMAHSGCGIIATYNARAFLEAWEGPRIYNLIELIGYFEENGAVCGGRFGIAPRMIAKCLERLGYQVKYFSVNKKMTEEELNEIGEKYPALIVTFFNNKNDITRMLHTVCITKKAGRFFAHNAVSFRKNAPEGSLNLCDAIKASASAPKLIYITAVFKQENNVNNG